jgi:hypothetical protein
MRLITQISLSVIFIFLLMANTLLVQEFKAEIPDTSKNEIHLRWVVQESSQTMHYTLKRKMVRDIDFVLVNTIQATASGSAPREYTYIDRNVFRNNSNSEPVLYELYVSYSDGSTDLLGQTEVNYSSTAIRRTWGSIKAMFQ